MKVIILLLLKEFWEPHWCFLCWNLDVLSPNFPLNLSPKTSESCMSYPKCRKCMHQMNELCDEHSLHLPERWSRLVISRTCKTPRFPHIPTSSSSEPVASQYALPWPRPNRWQWWDSRSSRDFWLMKREKWCVHFEAGTLPLDSRIGKAAILVTSFKSSLGSGTKREGLSGLMPRRGVKVT